MGSVGRPAEKKGIADNTLIVFFRRQRLGRSIRRPRSKRFKSNDRWNTRGINAHVRKAALRQASFGVVAWHGTGKPRSPMKPWAFWDLLPTFAETGQADLPTVSKRRPFRGLSFSRRESPSRDYFYWELHEKQRRFHPGDSVQPSWKAVRRVPRAVELYDLSSDFGETTDLQRSVRNSNESDRAKNQAPQRLDPTADQRSARDSSPAKKAEKNPMKKR